MSILDVAREGAADIVGYRFFSKDVVSHEEFFRFLESAKRMLYLVTGEIDPSVYEDTKAIQNFSRLLSQRGIISIVGHLGVDVYEQAREKLKGNNPILYGLKMEYPETLKIKWVSSRPEAHYGVADDMHVFFEGDHEPCTDRDVWYFYKEPDLASEWKSNFEQYIKLPKVREL